MSGFILKQDTNGTKSTLGVGELGYDNYTAGGDKGRVYVGDGTTNVALAKKSEVDSKLARTANAVSATKLATARTINGVAFDGTSNITVADDTKLPKTGGWITGNIEFNNGTSDSPGIGFAALDYSTMHMDNYYGKFRMFRNGVEPFHIDIDNKPRSNGNLLWHAGNDGDGSGLDADKLDGREATGFLWQDRASGTTRVYIAKVESGNGLRIGAYENGWVNHLYLGDTLSYNGSTVLTNKALGVCSITEYLSDAQLNGEEIGTVTAFQNAINNNSIVVLPRTSRIYLNASITVPNGHSIICLGGSDAPAAGSFAEIRLKVGTAMILIEANTTFENISIMGWDSSTGKFTTPAYMTGTGINTVGVGCSSAVTGPISNVRFKNCSIMGFGIGIHVDRNGSAYQNTRGSWRITDCNFDNNIDIQLGYCLDTMYIANCHSYPFLGINTAVVPANITVGTVVRREAFINCVNNYNDWTQVSHCFAHSNRKMIKGYFSGTVTGGGYDFEDYSTTTSADAAVNVGIEARTSDRAGQAIINGVRFNGGQVHIRAHMSSNDQNLDRINISGCTHGGASHQFVAVLDDNAGPEGGGYAMITGMTCSNLVNGTTNVTAKYLVGATNGAKVMVSGIVECNVLTAKYTGTVTVLGNIGY